MNKDKEILEQSRKQVKNKKQKYSKKYAKKLKKKLQVSMLSIVVILLLIVGSTLAELSMPLNTVKTNMQTKLSAEERKTLEEQENIENKQNNKEIAKIDEKGETTEINKETTGLEIKETTKESEESIKTTVNTPKLEDTETVTYIYNIDDLVRFRNSVNAGKDYAGKTVYVMEDIDMSPACSETVGSWTPIGATGTNFAGTFDGNYHTLSNLYYNSNAYSNVGLFVQNNGVIQNVILENVDIYAYKEQANDNVFVGGIVGTNNKSIINCGINSGRLIGYNVLFTTSKWKNIRVGGISGFNTKQISNCYNKANIEAQASNEKKCWNEAHAGGISGASMQGYIENCYNVGKIKAIANNSYVAGIVGLLYGDNQLFIKNSYNIGEFEVTASYASWNGGIAGINGWDSHEQLTPIINCYYGTSTTYSQYYWNGSVMAPSTSGRVSPTETLKTYAPTLGTAYENDDFNINGGYPILWWEAPTIELNKKQAYIQTGEQLQLEINSTVGARRTVPTTRECFNY